VDRADRVERAEAGRHALLEEQAEEVAIERADLFAHDDVDAELGMRARPVARAQRAADLVVVGDGHHVDLTIVGGFHDHLGTLGAVAPHRVHVQVGATVRTGSHCRRVWRRSVNGLSLSA
jgi:hypothetical protein